MNQKAKKKALNETLVAEMGRLAASITLMRATPTSLHVPNDQPALRGRGSTVTTLKCLKASALIKLSFEGFTSLTVKQLRSPKIAAQC